MDKCVILAKQGCGYVILAPKGHLLCGPKFGIRKADAILWAKAWVSSFDGWTVRVDIDES